MIKQCIFATIAVCGVTFTTVNPAIAGNLKSDKEIVENVNDIMNQMSAAQQEAVLKQAEIIQERLRNMSTRERNELIRTVRNVSSSIDFNNVNTKALEKIQPANLDDTMKNFKEYQQKF